MLLQWKVSFKHYTAVILAALERLAFTQNSSFIWDTQKFLDSSRLQTTAKDIKPITVKPSQTQLVFPMHFQTWNISVLVIFVLSYYPWFFVFIYIYIKEGMTV